MRNIITINKKYIWDRSKPSLLYQPENRDLFSDKTLPKFITQK